LLGLEQPKVSALVRGRVEGYSIDRLFRFRNALGQRVEIAVRPDGKGSKTGTVVVTQIERTATLRSMIEYLHANPVRRGLVAKAEDWEWSSARWYAGMRPVPSEVNSMVLDELSREGPPWAER
jgi:hypothetical protein